MINWLRLRLLQHEQLAVGAELDNEDEDDWESGEEGEGEEFDDEYAAEELDNFDDEYAAEELDEFDDEYVAEELEEDRVVGADGVLSAEEQLHRARFVHNPINGFAPRVMPPGVFDIRRLPITLRMFYNLPAFFAHSPAWEAHEE